MPPPMKFPTHVVHRRYCGCRTFMDGPASTIKFVRDRGLDHAVEREKNLRPLVNVKNLIKSEPSKSLPISIISQHKDSLKIPSRPIEFIRKYPSVFQEFLPGGIGIHPHIKLTPEVLDIDAEEHLVYQSVSYKQLVADRLLKLLMISRMNKIPISILDELKWDLGLPQNYLKTLVSDFPDYFRLVGSEDSGQVELVCWSDELAVSVLEKKTMKGGLGYSKGMPIAFPVKFSKGFEMDKKVKKWWDDWQKLPYVSPYENALHLSPKTDESDKYAAAVLHEILNLFVAKKAGKDDVLCVGEYLGIRSRFKSVLLHHPHIFYLSSKTGTYTVVLKEAYKRGLLIESNPLMNIRSRYIHLMHTVKEHGKDHSISSGSNQEKKAASNAPKKEAGADGDDSEEENNGVSDALSGSEVEDGDSSDEEDGYEGSRRGSRKTVAVSRRRTNKRKNVDLKAHLRDGEGERAMGKYHGMSKTKIPPNGSSNVHWKSQQRSSNADLCDGEGERAIGKYHGMTKSKISPNGSSNVHWKSQQRSSNAHLRDGDGEGERAMGKYHGMTKTKIPPNDSSNGHWKSQQRSSNAHLRDGEGERAMGKYHGMTKTKFPPNGSSNVHWKSQQRSSNLHQRSRRQLPV